MEKNVTLTAEIKDYLVKHISIAKDRVHAENVLIHFNSIVNSKDYTYVPFVVKYEVAKHSFDMKFFTEDKTVSMKQMNELMKNRQVMTVSIIPDCKHTQMRGYVQVQLKKSAFSSDEEYEQFWELKKVQLDCQPELDGRACKIDKQILSEILQYTYGMYDVMPLLTVKINSSDDGSYTIICENIPAINYSFLCSIKNKLSTYIKSIDVNVHRGVLRYKMRLHNSPMNSERRPRKKRRT